MQNNWIIRRASIAAPSFIMTIVCIILFLAGTACADSQIAKKSSDASREKDIRVTGIRMGMTRDEVIGIMGEPSRVVSMEDEKQAWTSYGYNVKQALPFYIGFDEMLIFEAGANRPVCAWKVFFKNGRVNFVIYSSFIFGEQSYGKLELLPGLKFMGDRAAMIQSMGENFLYFLDESKNEQYHYFDKGVTVFIVRSQIRAIHAFQPLDPASAAAFKVHFPSQTENIR